MQDRGATGIDFYVYSGRGVNRKIASKVIVGEHKTRSRCAILVDVSENMDLQLSIAIFGSSQLLPNTPTFICAEANGWRGQRCKC